MPSIKRVSEPDANMSDDERHGQGQLPEPVFIVSCYYGGKPKHQSQAGDANDGMGSKGSRK